MTTPRDIEIVQGQTWTELFLVEGLVSTGNGLRMHLRDHHGATLLRAALAHDNAANERISFATGGVLANLGASISTGWDLQGQPVRRWIYSIERYSLTDVDDVTVLFAGTAIVKSNPTDESSITKVAPHPSYDESCLRFDVVQTLTEPQKIRLRANAGIGEGGALVAWGGIGGTLSDQTDLVSALAAKSSTSHTHTGTYEPYGTVAAHGEASDPHPGYLQNLAIHGTADVIVTVGTNGEVLSRSSYTPATLIAAAAAAAPVQSVAGRTGAVVIAVGDVSGAEASANKAQANGYASLDSSGKVPQAQIPAIAITEYLGDVASQAAMLALSGQKGDWCTRSDTGATWIITGTDPTLLGSWTSVRYPASPVTSVAGRTGAVTISSADITDSSSAGRAVLTAADAGAQRTALGAQAALVSGTNIKTINSTSLLGSGDIAISANPGGSTTQLQYNNAGAFGGMSGTAWDDTNRAETRTGATVTTSNPVQSFTQTWNASGVTFTGWLLNVTSTASAAGSLLADWQVGGVSKAKLRKDGWLFVADDAGITGMTATTTSMQISNGGGNPDISFYTGGTPRGLIYANGAAFSGSIQIGNASKYAGDIFLSRNASGVAEFTNGSTGTFRDLKLRSLIASETVKLATYTVATLPSAATAGSGSLAMVSDANATTNGSTVAAGGSNKVAVKSDGTNWIILG